MKPACLAAALLLLAACDEAEVDCGSLDGVAGWAELGDGEVEDEFVPLESDAVMLVERGNQGGQHIWVSTRLGDINPGSEDLWDGLRNGDLPEVEFVVTSPDGIISPDNRRPMVLVRDERGDYLLMHNLVVIRHFAELPDDWAELDYAQVEADMEEVEHDLTVRIEDVCETVVETTTTILLDFPDRDSGSTTPRTVARPEGW